MSMKETPQKLRGKQPTLTLPSETLPSEATWPPQRATFREEAIGLLLNIANLPNCHICIFSSYIGQVSSDVGQLPTRIHTLVVKVVKVYICDYMIYMVEI
jgi:hypothetical protein